MLRKFSFILYLFVIIPATNLTAQENYQVGTIVTVSGDTIAGWIEYMNWSSNPRRINFKTSLDSPKTSYGVVDLRQFEVSNEIYVSAFVEHEISPTHMASLDYSPAFNTVSDTVFLQAIVLGEKDLFLFRSLGGKENFYLREKDEFVLLLYKQYFKKQDGNNTIQANKFFIGQLTAYFNDCPSIANKLGNLSYKLERLKNAFREYTACKQSEILYEHSQEKIELRFGIFAGPALSKVDFEGDVSPYLTDVEYPMTVGASTGVSFDIVFPKNHKRWSVYNELMLTYFEVSNEYSEVFIPDLHYSSTYVDLAFGYFKVFNMLKFNYYSRSVKLFLNAGLSNGFLMSYYTQKRTETTFVGTTTVRESDAIKNKKNHEIGLAGGGGMNLKNISLEIRYEIGNGMSNMLYLGSTTQRIHILLAYQF